MITISLPDGSQREFPGPVTVSGTAVEAPRRPEHAARGAAPETRDDRAGDDRRRGRARQHTGFDRLIQPPPPAPPLAVGIFLPLSIPVIASLPSPFHASKAGRITQLQANQGSNTNVSGIKCFWFCGSLIAAARERRMLVEYSTHWSNNTAHRRMGAAMAAKRQEMTAARCTARRTARGRARYRSVPFHHLISPPPPVCPFY